MGRCELCGCVYIACDVNTVAYCNGPIYFHDGWVRAPFCMLQELRDIGLKDASVTHPASRSLFTSHHAQHHLVHSSFKMYY